MSLSVIGGTDKILSIPVPMLVLFIDLIFVYPLVDSSFEFPVYEKLALRVFCVNNFLSFKYINMKVTGSKISGCE